MQAVLFGAVTGEEVVNHAAAGDHGPAAGLLDAFVMTPDAADHVVAALWGELATGANLDGSPRPTQIRSPVDQRLVASSQHRVGHNPVVAVEGGVAVAAGWSRCDGDRGRGGHDATSSMVKIHWLSRASSRATPIVAATSGSPANSR